MKKKSFYEVEKKKTCLKAIEDLQLNLLCVRLITVYLMFMNSHVSLENPSSRYSQLHFTDKDIEEQHDKEFTQ